MHVVQKAPGWVLLAAAVHATKFLLGADHVNPDITQPG